MSNPKLLEEALALPVEEQLELVDQLWSAIAKKPDNLKLTPQQMEELERRLAEFEADPGPTYTWEEVRDRALRE